MLNWLAGRLEVSTTVAAVLLVVAAVQLALQLYALADLTMRAAVRGDKKWVWALVIVLGSLPGTITYLAVGRISTKASGASGATAAGEDTVRRAVDTLYGPSGRR